MIPHISGDDAQSPTDQTAGLFHHLQICGIGKAVTGRCDNHFRYSTSHAEALLFHQLCWWFFLALGAQKESRKALHALPALIIVNQQRPSGRPAMHRTRPE